MYIRAKHYKGRTYYAIVRSERDGGKVYQRQVTYLGKHSTLESAINDLEAEIENGHLIVEQWLIRFNDPEMAAESRQRLQKVIDRLETLRVLQREMRKRRAVTT